MNAAQHNGVRCLDFHRPEWTHRTLSLYYVKYKDGSLFLRRAFDAVDAVDSLDRSQVVEYGNVVPGGGRI